MNARQVAIVLAILTALGVLVAFDAGRLLSLDSLKHSQAALEEFRARQPVLTAMLYLAIYVSVTALSIPGATILTLAGGAIFGWWWGTALACMAASIGATLAFGTARTLLRDSLEARFGARLAEINRGLDKDGAFYLFTLRLVPLFPFFVINLLMGLTRMRAWTFWWVSLLGMLAGTSVYVNAGTQLARLDSLQGILSPALIGSFVLLGVFPLLARKVLERVRARKVYGRWMGVRPHKFDRNLVVIGAGAGGLVTAYIAAAVKASVTLVKRTAWAATA